MHNRGRFVSRTMILLGDILLLNIGFIAAFYIRFLGTFPQENFPAYIRIAPWVSLFFVLLLKIYDLYARKIKPKDEILFSLNISLFLTLMFGIVISFMLRAFAFPRSVLVISFFCQLIILSLWRLIIADWDRKRYGDKRLVIVGLDEEVKTFLRKISSGDSIFKPVAIMLSGGAINTEGMLVGHESETEKVLSDIIPDVLLLGASLTRERKKDLVSFALANNIEVMVVPDVYDIMLAQVQLETVEDTLLFNLGGFIIPPKEAFVKRFIDIFLALFALIVTSPVMFIVAILIKLDSTGPIFFIQERMSEGGKTFKLYKFRTMVADAEKATGPVLAEANDPRITKLGNFLRHTRLDEIPQFINVLFGDMSIVGPRPERPFFVERFTSEIPEYAYRMRVKAGITGLAQVEGKYDTTAEDKLRYDLLYAKQYSPFLDLRIILHTLKVLFMKGKAR